MDEKESLKRKIIIEVYRMVGLFSIIVGPVIPVIGLMYYPLNPGLANSFGPFWFPFLIGCSVAVILLGVLLKLRAGVLEMEPGGYDKKRERRKWQYCPFCGKELQPDWEFCGYCGKRLKQPDWEFCGYCGKRLKKGD